MGMKLTGFSANFTRKLACLATEGTRGGKDLKRLFYRREGQRNGNGENGVKR